LSCSAYTNEGVPEVWQAVERFVTQARDRGAFELRRREQALAWLDALVDEGLREAFAARADAAHLRRELEAQVATGQLPAPAAARQLLRVAGMTHPPS
jgi:LAO/AO transport system kinase